MKIKSSSRIGRVFKRLFNFAAWLDVERIKVFTRYLINAIKNIFVPNAATETESFAAAKIRLKLSDAELIAREKGLLRLSLAMVGMSVGVFIYAIYLFYTGSIKGGILGVVLMFIALVLAFRYHFWYFQIKERKLGCTIQEWFKQGLMGDKR